MTDNKAVKEYISFDGGYSTKAQYQQPDRYRMLVDADAGGYARIARGGGYSYAAASFGAEGVTQEMASFNRVIRFVPQERLIEVEAGITLGDLIGITTPQGVWLPVVPGYPGITVGGCIAANVHGKNPARNGAFINFVEEIVLFHPANGVTRVSRSADPHVFELTCGGYGLTGVILSATLRLETLPGSQLSRQRTTVGSLVEAARVLREL
ncbi:MAG: FAD-binding oxidoreductase, partial [Chloroflexota bacterium]